MAAAAAAAAAAICTPRSALGSLDGRAVVAPGARRAGPVAVFARVLKPVEERFKIQHEKNVPAERLKELGVERWSKWECGPNVTYRHAWQVDEQIYISKGSVMVTPEDCDDSAYFYQGDVVRFPKWLVADLTFDEDYEQCYRFLAYGD